VTALGSLATALARNVNIYSVVSVRLVVRLSVCPSVRLHPFQLLSRLTSNLDFLGVSVKHYSSCCIIIIIIIIRIRVLVNTLQCGNAAGLSSILDRRSKSVFLAHLFVFSCWSRAEAYPFFLSTLPVLHC